jgi:N-formylglutamate deformylase
MIFHLPHSSGYIQKDHRKVYRISSDQLNAELIKMTDAYTDELFGAHMVVGDSKVVFPVSRLVLDPERFVDDQDEPMATTGMGVIYTRTSNGDILRDNPQPDERAKLIGDYYVPHHKELAAAVDGELGSIGRALIIDCHSFPSNPLPYEIDKNPHRPDICIGIDPFHTPPGLLAACKELVCKVGWSFAVNRPFCGSIVPQKFYRKEKRVSSIMIEINRRLYMDEVSGEKSSSCDDCLKRLGAVIEDLRE